MLKRTSDMLVVTPLSKIVNRRLQVKLSVSLSRSIKEKARQMGFVIVGATVPDPPARFPTFENWIREGHHGEMSYLASERSLQRRADPKLILPECKSILVLGTPYSPPASNETKRGRVSAYARGEDYHEVLPERLKALVAFIEERSGRPIPNRWYTDTGPILERDLAQRAGLGWIGKNSCLINPQKGSYFLLAEIFLGVEIEPDLPFETDRCGSCNRCVAACPMQCILPNRTLDARRCISYLTIELKSEIPNALRPSLGDWVFGCDVCQAVCPWNRFALRGDRAFEGDLPSLTESLSLAPMEFNRRFKTSPVRRAKRRGFLRNVAVALGNVGDESDLPFLEKAANDDEPIIREHARWAMEQIRLRAEK